MCELDIFGKMNAIGDFLPEDGTSEIDPEKRKRLNEHKAWLRSIPRERPDSNTRFKIGVYIRYFNQTKYENYLEYHKQQFAESIRMCRNWELVDFYVDEGSSAPNMENAPEWSRLLCDCMNGNINLIITQKISNISKKTYEAAFCARILAAQNPPIGIYFISEDIYTLASYYQGDLRDTNYLPDDSLTVLPDRTPEEGELHD